MLKLKTVNRVINDSSGFTMIEVLMSIVVLSVGLLAISLMQAYFASGNSQSRQIVRATDIAMAQIEALSNLPTSDPVLSPGPHMAVDSSYERPYGVNWTVTQNSTNNTLDVTVSVIWSDDGTNHSVTFPWVKNN